MLLAVYSLAVAAVFAIVYTADAHVANALAMFFVVAVLIPAVAHDWHKQKGSQDA